MWYTKALLALLGSVALAATPANIQKNVETAPQWILPLSVREIVQRIESARIKAIMMDLIPCESQWEEQAKNPIDLDGTPSWGPLQFKPGTLLYFGHRYHTIPDDLEDHEIYNLLYDGAVQIATATGMIEEYGHDEKFWRQQWPWCSAKYNYFVGY